MAKIQIPSYKTPVFRGSYVSLITPSAMKSKIPKEPTYQITIVLEKTNPEHKLAIQEIAKLVRFASSTKHGLSPSDGKPGLKLKEMNKSPISDGDTIKNENHRGCWLVKCSSKYKPMVIDAKSKELTTEDEVYSGAWYRAKITAYAWTHDEGGSGVSITIQSAQKVKDDKRFGGGSDAREDFAEFVTADALDSDGPADDFGKAAAEDEPPY